MSAPGPAALIAGAKLRLRARIAARRQRCALLGARVVRPLRWVDQVETWWRALGPAGKVGGALAGWFAWRAVRRSGGENDRTGSWWGEIIHALVGRLTGTLFS